MVLVTDPGGRCISNTIDSASPRGSRRLAAALGSGMDCMRQEDISAVDTLSASSRTSSIWSGELTAKVRISPQSLSVSINCSSTSASGNGTPVARQWASAAETISSSEKIMRLLSVGMCSLEHLFPGRAIFRDGQRISVRKSFSASGITILLTRHSRHDPHFTSGVRFWNCFSSFLSVPRCSLPVVSKA
jgi:hypothetical protein